MSNHVKIQNSKPYFTPQQKNEILEKQNYRDPITGEKLDKRYNPYEFDHIDGNNNNNETSNCQALSIVVHRIKTTDLPYYKKLCEDIVERNKFISERIKCLYQNEEIFIL
jgi:hypothetical protein